MAAEVDSYRFLDLATRQVVKAWSARASYDRIPWTPLRRPIRDCTVAIVSSAGLAMRDDAPFDQEGERRDPWWGDPSFRRLAADAREGDVTISHLHFNATYAEQDLNCIFPVQPSSFRWG